MSDAPPPLRSLTLIVRAAAWLSPGAVPAEDHRSLPIPATGPRGLRVGFLFAPEREHEDPETHARAPRLWAPEYVAWVRADTAAVDELVMVSGAELGVQHPADTPLAGPVPPRLDAAPDEQARLHAAYDAVLGWFAAGSEQVPPPVKARVVELDALFWSLAQPALVPWYRSVGQGFFAWVDRVKA